MITLPNASPKHLALVATLAGTFLLQTAIGAETVKVFVLAGQSNMEGKAKNTLLEYQAAAAETADFFAHFREGKNWAVRDDVFIKFLGRKGPLTIGYGSPDRTGAELEFGWMMGDRFDEPVVLVKAAWGGHSLFKMFRSPSSGYPSEEALQALMEKAVMKVERENRKSGKNNPLPTMEDVKAPFGSSYRNLLAEVKDVMNHCGEMFPKLKEKKPELAGFFWFQGFNDKFGDYAPGEYKANMTHFIQDVRKDLNAPNLPFVIAAIGNNGSKEAEGSSLTVREAQMAMNDVPEFKANVKAFRTDLLVDKAAEATYPNWKQDIDKWRQVGSDRPYHYYGSAIWYTRIGHAAGEAMLELMNQ